MRETKCTLTFPCHDGCEDGKEREIDNNFKSPSIYILPSRAYILISERRLLLSSILDAILMGDLRLQELDDDINTEKHLRLFMENAVESGLARKLAQAHYCTGEHFLSKVRNHRVGARS